jgi:hypothetical protein
MIKNTKQNDEELLRKFKELPKLYQGKEVIISFVNSKGFKGVGVPYEGYLKALGLPLGATIGNWVKVQPSGEEFEVFAKDEMVKEVLDIPEGAEVTAKVKTLFGIEREAVWTDDGSLLMESSCKGLLIIELIKVEEKSHENA